MRRLVALLAVALVGGLLGLAVVEVGLRLTGAGRWFIVPDTVIGYRLTPDFSRTVTEFDEQQRELRFTTNNLGLRRDSATSVEKPPGAVRILVLGDSQTEGIVENADGYPAVVERVLGERARVEVLNAGVSGYSPLLEYLWFREWGTRLKPDVVVLALYSGNDLGELTARVGNFAGFGPWSRLATMARDAGAGWTILRPGAPEPWPEADSWLRSKSRAYDLVRSRLRGPSGERIESIGAAFRQCPGCMQALWQEWMSQERAADYAEAGVQLREVLSRFRVLAEEIGARPLALLLPTKLDVEPDSVRDSVQAVQSTLGLATPPATFTQAVRDQMLSACASEGLEVVDLLPALREARQRGGRDLYWIVDWHLNAEGNRAVAEAIAPRLGALARRGA